jgi:Fur family ferric uptake transcriptional regulator
MNPTETSSNPNRIDIILGRLRAQGRRMTTSRRAVIEVLAGTNEHLTVEDIAARVQSVHEEIHLSTVYRTLEALESWDVVEHIHRGHAPPIHHLAHTHPHLVCETCGRVYDIPPEELDHLGTRLREQYGFELHATHFALMGQCNQHAMNGGRRA